MASSRVASPTKTPARMSLARRRTFRVTKTAMNPQIRLDTRNAGSIVVRIAAVPHVLGEILRLMQLTDIVEVTADPRHRGIGADRLARRFRQRRDHERMLVGTGGLEHHQLQQRVIEIGHFQPGDLRGDPEEILEDW